MPDVQTLSLQEEDVVESGGHLHEVFLHFLFLGDYANRYIRYPPHLLNQYLDALRLPTTDKNVIAQLILDWLLVQVKDMVFRVKSAFEVINSP